MRDFAEKDSVLDEVIRKNSELTQENQDLTEEINESVEIAKEKDRLVLELAYENNEKDVFLDEVIRENSKLAQETLLRKSMKVWKSHNKRMLFLTS